MKIITAIDLMEGKVVRLYKGDRSKKTIDSENQLEIAKKLEYLTEFEFNCLYENT